MLFQTYGNVNDSYSTRSKNHPSPATLDEAIARNCYISVVITPSSGYNLSITQLNTKLLGDNSLKYGVFSSVSGFEIGDIISTQDGGGIRTINLAGHTSIIEPVEFRFYAYGQDYVWGYAGFGQWDDHTNDDLVITGSIKNNDMPSFPTDLSATNLTETGFTLSDPETSKTYGVSATAGTLVLSGSNGITVAADKKGWYILTVDVNALTYTLEPYMIAIVGDATGSWDNDQDMEYDSELNRWSITLNLVGGKFIKFRRNDGWAWNMGLADGETGGLTGKLKQGGVGNDIPVAESGNYTVYYTILSDAAGSYQLIKN